MDGSAALLFASFSFLLLGLLTARSDGNRFIEMAKFKFKILNSLLGHDDGIGHVEIIVEASGFFGVGSSIEGGDEL